MKKSAVIIISTFLVLAGTSVFAQKIQHIDAEQFQREIFDYKTDSEWNFKGDTPVIIDFYATWCGPCKKVAPILQELQDEYEGKLIIYKVNVDKEKELAGVFGVRSLPTFLFIPKNGKPTKATGALPKETFQQAFKEIFGL